MDGSGTFSISLPDNTTITPIGSGWRFSVCPNSSSPCVSTQITVSGASMSVSTQLSSVATGPRFSAGPKAYGYLDVEVSPVPLPGGTYWNVTNSVWRQWTGSGWQNVSSGGSTSWSSLTNATTDLLLDNRDSLSEFKQNSGDSWTWFNSNSTSGGTVPQGSPVLVLGGEYYAGSGSGDVEDFWQFYDQIATGTNPTSTLSFSHVGSPGAATVSVPALTVNGVPFDPDSVWITDPPYDAACDAHTDDTAAIQAAINSGKIVNFPMSRYSALQQCNYATTLTIPAQTVRIEGNDSELNYTGTTLAIDATAGPILTIENLILNSQNASSSSTGISYAPSMVSSAMTLNNDEICAGSVCGGNAFDYSSITFAGGNLIISNLERDGSLNNTATMGSSSLYDWGTVYLGNSGPGTAYLLNTLSALFVDGFQDESTANGNTYFLFNRDPTAYAGSIGGNFQGSAGNTIFENLANIFSFTGNIQVDDSGATLFTGGMTGVLKVGVSGGAVSTIFNGGSTVQDRCDGGTLSGAYVAAGSTQATACTVGGGSLVSTGLVTP